MNTIKTNATETETATINNTITMEDTTMNTTINTEAMETEMTTTKVVRFIKNKNQFRALLDGMMKKEQINILSVTIDVTRNGKLFATIEVSSTPLSRVFDKRKVKDLVKVRHQHRIVSIKNKFSFDFISVSVTNEAATVAENIFGGAIYLVHQENGWIKMFADLRGDGYTDLETGKDVSKLPEGDVYSFKGLAWTASNKRQKTMVFRNVTDGDDRFARLDLATLGAMTIMKNNYGLDASKFMKLQKDGGYVGNVMTGSVDFGIVTGYVRFYSKWENSTNETFLTKAYDNARVEYMAAIRKGDAEAISVAKAKLADVKRSKLRLKDINTQDGQMYINVRVFAEMVKSKYNIDIDVNALTGLMIQLRPGTIKASALIVSEEVFNTFVEGTKDLAATALEKAIANAVGKDNEKELIEEAKRLYKVEYVGDVKNLLYVADDNCIKLEYDMERKITMEILAFAKCSEGKTSKQLAETVLYAANEAGENGAQLLYNILKLSVDEKTASLTVNKRARLLTPEEIQKGLECKYINDIVMSIAPRFIEQNKAFFNSTWRQAINSVTNMIDGLSGAITSHNRRLASDPAFILTGGKITDLLKTGEVFINDRRMTKVAMVKYPKMGLREFYYANNVSMSEIKNRLNYFVKLGKINKEEAAKVVKFYSQLDSFVAVLPAKSVIAFACAGLDFDYDGALFIEYTTNPKNDKDVYTNQLVDLLGKTKMKAVVIQN